MTESLSLFDLIAAVDAMTFRGPVARPMSEDKRGQSGVPRCHEGASVDDEPPTAIVMPYEYAESFALRNECDSFTVYEVEGFGVGKGAIFDFIIEDNARLRKIFDLYDLRLQNESGQSVSMQAATAVAKSASSADTLQENETLKADDTDDYFGELLELQLSDEADDIPLTFVDGEQGDEPEIFFEEMHIGDEPGQNKGLASETTDPAVTADTSVSAANEGNSPHDAVDLVNKRVDSVEIAAEAEMFETPQERLDHFNPTMHTPVTHYPLREEELEDIEADIEAEPSLIIEERLDDIYEKLSEYRRTGIDITDSVILLNSDSDIERLLNSNTPLEAGELRKLLNHFDALIGKLPDKDREAFARSEYFSLYLHIMNQLESQNG